MNVSTIHEGVTYKYVMLPIYVGNFNYRKKLYNFYVNGETGKVVGKTPKSPLRILFAVLCGLAVIVGVALLFYLQWKYKQMTSDYCVKQVDKTPKILYYIEKIT